MNDLKFSICIPAYNGASVIGEALESILRQDFSNYEIIVCDDASSDDTEQAVRNFKDDRIKYYRNETNLGYGKNLQVCKSKASGDVLFLMGQDDILLKNALSKTHNAFMLGDEIGAVTRPYYWFDEDLRKPVRAVTPYDGNEDRVISILDGKREVQKIFESLGQLSGLAYRTKYMDTNFHEETFPAHIYPFASIARKHKVVFLKDYTVAVRIATSQTRFKSSVYDLSPTESWVKMFNTFYTGEKYKKVREAGIEQITKNFVGLVQIRNYGTLRNLIREIFVLIKYRWTNIINPKFWFFSLGTVLIPRKMLIWLVDNYKGKILSRRLKRICGAQKLPFKSAFKPEYYSEKYYAERTYANLDPYLKFLLLKVLNFNVDKSVKVLDVGCGTGIYINFFKKIGVTAIGIDPSPSAVKISKQILASATEIPFNDDTFDLVFSAHVIEHLTDMEVAEMLKESRRVLKPKGKIFLLTPNGWSPGRFILGKEWFNDPAHINIHNPRKVKSALKRNQFKNIKFMHKIPPTLQRKSQNKFIIHLPYFGLYKIFSKFPTVQDLLFFFVTSTPLAYFRDVLYVTAEVKK